MQSISVYDEQEVYLRITAKHMQICFNASVASTSDGFIMIPDRNHIFIKVHSSRISLEGMENT